MVSTVLIAALAATDAVLPGFGEMGVLTPALDLLAHVPSVGSL